MSQTEKPEFIFVTMCAAAYPDMKENTKVEIDTTIVSNVLPVDPALGIGRSVIYFSDGATMNVTETLNELQFFHAR